MFYRITYFNGGHVLQVGMFYGRTCQTWCEKISNRKAHFTGFYILQKDMSYGRTCLTGEHVLLVDMSCVSACLA